jgi:hypothetical protein
MQVRETSWIGLHETQGNDSELGNTWGVDLARRWLTPFVLKTTVFNLCTSMFIVATSYFNWYPLHWNYLIKQVWERVEITPVHFRCSRTKWKASKWLAYSHAEDSRKFNFFTVRTDTRTCHSISLREVWKRQLRHNGPWVVLIHT